MYQVKSKLNCFEEQLKKKGIRTNYMKVEIDETSLNIKWRLCRKSDKTVNHMISEYSKPKQYKTKHD